MTGSKRSTEFAGLDFANLDTKGLIRAIDASTTSDDSAHDQLIRACNVALKRELDKSQRFLNTVDTVIVGLDRAGRVTLVNKKGCELLGYTENELLGRSWFSTCLPSGSEEVSRVFQRIMRGELKALDYYENEVLTRSGTQRMMAWHNSYMQDSEGAIIGTLSAGEDITARKIAEQRNAQLLRENRRLMQRLFAVQEGERRRLARELHDELGQWLSAVQAHTHLISDLAGEQLPDIRESANEIQLSVNRVFQNVRRMIRDLRPVVLDTLGLEDSLAELVTSWESHHSDIYCQLNISDSLEDLDESLAITIYRIIQEALTNITNHAGASKVKIGINRTTAVDTTIPVVQLTISDNGKGIRPKIRHDGMGLLGMRERVLATSGTFELESSPGQGVVIKVELPSPDVGNVSETRRNPI
jgi:PAS domain S-box-containing protein